MRPLQILGLTASCVVLTGCFKVNITETLNLNGTADFAVKVDASAMMNMANQISNSMSYDSCADPDLLEKYEVESLAEPAIKEEETVVTTTYECLSNDEDLSFSLAIKTEKNGGSFTATRNNIDDCYEPALLTQYGLDDPQTVSYTEIEGDFPMIKTTSETKITEVTCMETDSEITITSQNIDAETGERSGKSSFTTSKPDPQDADDENSMCEDDPVEAQLHPLNYVGCESDAQAGISEIKYERINTEGYTIDGDDVIYTLDSLIDEAKSEVNTSASENQEDQNDKQDLFNNNEIDPEAMGMEVTYSIISPWPLADNSHGEIVDGNELRIILFKLDDDAEIQVRLVGAATDIEFNENEPTLKVKVKLVNFLERIYEKVSESKASNANKIKYLNQIDTRFQTWAGTNPKKLAIANYMTQKLEVIKSSLKPEVENDPLSSLRDL